MIPVFFGSRQKQLFGVYYPSKNQPSLMHGVLLCPPVGHEYMRTHMVLRQLSALLSSHGFDVFKFDYYGVGDSAGKSRQGNIAAWKDDVRTAYQELKDMSGVQSISIVGLRLGALIAALAASNGLTPKNLLLWDPVVNGGKFIQELRYLSSEALTGKAEHNEGDEVLVGFPYSAENISSITKVDFLNLEVKAAKKILLVISENRNDYNKLYDQLKLSGKNIVFGNLGEFSRNIGPGNKKNYQLDTGPMIAQWSSQQEIDQALFAHHAINEIASLLKASV